MESNTPYVTTPTLPAEVTVTPEWERRLLKAARVARQYGIKHDKPTAIVVRFDNGVMSTGIVKPIDELRES